MIAVTGATGQVGGRVATRLAGLGLPQRLVVRDASRAPSLERAEVVEASGYHAREEMRRAFDGVQTVFLVSAAEAANRIEQHATAIDAAAEAGVQRIVYTSFLAAAPDATFTFARDHYAAEEHLRASGLRFTSMRQSMYLDFLPEFAKPDGVIRGPAGDGRLAPVARDDVADVAVAILTGEGHDGQVYDVTGRERLSMSEIAERLTQLTGSQVTYEDETLEQAYASRAGYGAPEFEVAGWVTSYAAISTGEMDVVSDTVLKLAGHEPQTLAEYVG
ncbi:MAG: hypothetical protein QOC95_923 [Thermoleophilaceae bacterium]|nr:hypothetical protein [Thermoleophilaceae bacterium]